MKKIQLPWTFELLALAAASFLLNCFLNFIRLFWNHVFTMEIMDCCEFSCIMLGNLCNYWLPCVSDNPKAEASSTLSGVDRYLGLKKLFHEIFGFWASKLINLPLSFKSLLQSRKLRITKNCSRFSPSTVSQRTHSHSNAQYFRHVTSITTWKIRKESCKNLSKGKVS